MLEERMRRGEVYHSLRVPDNNYIILRIDGRAFHTHVKEAKYKRPYDVNFHRKMINATKLLIEEFNGLFGYTQSDEISVLLSLEADIYDREIEKLVSLSSSIVSASYNYSIEPLDIPIAFFDSRVWVSGSQKDVYDYFYWRISDSFKNCVSAWAYWTARDKLDLNPRAATKHVDGPTSEKHDFLMSMGINPAKLPEWQKNGTALFWTDYSKDGFNPIIGLPVKAKRRTLIEESPHKDIMGWLQNRVFDVAMLDIGVVKSQVPDCSGW